MIATELPRADDRITIRLEFRDKGVSKAKESFTNSVGKYFSEKGHLDEKQLQRDLQVAIFKMEEHLSKKDR